MIEQAREFSPTGEILFIADNGLCALNRLVPDATRKLGRIAAQQAVSGTNFEFHNADGSVIETSCRRQPSATTSWYNVQSMLRNAVPKNVVVRQTQISCSTR